MTDTPTAVTLDALLGREPTVVEPDTAYLTGRRVMVTGAGGSIGSELCRQLHQHQPSALITLDRDETALCQTNLSIHGRHRLDDPNTILADLRDTRRIVEIMGEYRPQVVFHAAALKHQPLLERFPGEAIKTNAWGTVTTLVAAAAAGVDTFVNVSTDKAADPVCVLGSSKRIGERVVAAVAATTGRRFVSVRFGNVLGSRGSVVDTFTAQASAGLPLTVTHPNVTRYLMTVGEAVGLVVHAGSIGEPGEVLVLDMGDPVRIVDLARAIAPTAPIVYTGLLPGERLAERLLGEAEVAEPSGHKLITRVVVPPLDPMATVGLDPWGAPGTVAGQLLALCWEDPCPSPYS